MRKPHRDLHDDARKPGKAYQLEVYPLFLIHLHSSSGVRRAKIEEAEIDANIDDLLDDATDEPNDSIMDANSDDEEEEDEVNDLLAEE